MGQWKVKLDQMEAVVLGMEDKGRDLRQSMSGVKRLRNILSRELKWRGEIGRSLVTVEQQLEQCRTGWGSLCQTGRNMIQTYRNCEKKLLDETVKGSERYEVRKRLNETIQFNDRTMTKEEFLRWIRQNAENRVIAAVQEGDPVYDSVIEKEPGFLDAVTIGLPNSIEIVTKEAIGWGAGKDEWGGNYTTKLVEQNIEAILNDYLDQGMLTEMNEFCAEHMEDYNKIAELLQKTGNANMAMAQEVLETVLEEGKLEELGLDKFFKYAEKIGYLVDFGTFGVEQLAKFLADYSGSIHVLESLQDAVGADTTTATAINNLMDRYTNLAYSVLEDGAQKGLEIVITAVLDYFGGPVNDVLDVAYTASGMKSYGENIANLQALQIQHGEVYEGYVELQNKFLHSITQGTEMPQEDYQKLENTFKYLKNSKIQQYEILKDLAKPGIKDQIQSEIDRLKEYDFGESYPQMRSHGGGGGGFR